MSRTAHIGRGEAGAAAHRGKHQALGEQLPQQPRAAGAHGDAHGDLPLPRCRAREQQVRHVGRGDQQHQHHRAHQHHQRRAQWDGHQPVVERLQMDAPVLYFGILEAHAARHRVHLGLRLLHRHAGLEPPDGDDHVLEADLFGAVDGQRRPDVAFGQERGRFRRDPHHRVGDAVQHHGLPQQRGLTAEAPLPETFADHGHRRTSGQVFTFAESAARHRPDA